MNMSLLMLIGMFGLHDNIHTVWDNVDYEDPNIIQVTEDELKLMITHNQSIGNDNINQINIYDDNIRDKYQGTCVLIGWANNNTSLTCASPNKLRLTRGYYDREN